MSRSKGLLFLAVLIVSAPPVLAEVHVAVRDGREVYEMLDRLEAEGAIRSGLLSTKPVSRREVLRLVGEAEASREAERPEIRILIDALRESFAEDSAEVSYLKPIGRISAEYIFTDSPLPLLDYNNDGDLHREGSNVRLKANSRGRLSIFSYSVTPEGRISGGDKVLTAREAYATLDLWELELAAGRESMWWGPGRHGAILLSNNSEPLTLVRLSNPEPALLPWIFRRLGPFRFLGFAGRLEKDRSDVPEPIFWGLRFDFKPHPMLEVGLERTAFMGGQGRPEGLSAWWDSFTGKGENDPGGGAGDQKAGFDLKLTVPWRIQPVQLYLEAAGEDSAGGLPSRWAYLSGIYLPRIGSVRNLDFRAEFATTHYPRLLGKGEHVPDFWYNHILYTQGYTFKGRIIGHHMGTDSRNLFLESSWRLPGHGAKVTLYYDLEEHNLSGDVRETKDEIGVRASMRLDEGFAVGASYRYGTVNNVGNVSGFDEELNRVEVTCEVTL